MLHPARCKGITVDQSKVLKSRLFRFFGGHPVYQINIFLSELMFYYENLCQLFI